LHSPDAQDIDAAISIGGPDSVESLSNVIVRNCFIRDYEQGVSIAPPRTDKSEMRQLYWQYENDLDARHAVLSAKDDELRSYAPRNVRIENVHMNNTRGVGIYIYAYAHEVALDHVSVQDNGSGPGLYLDTGSRNNTILDSCFVRTAREGIAIDSSAYNTIAGSYFADNAEGGIFLYKNANERVYPPNYTGSEKIHSPRTQHAAGNRIEYNVFAREQRSVWVASRASRNYEDSSLFYGDPIVYQGGGYEHRRDFAERTVIRANTFSDSRRAAIIVEDDHTLIVDNYFESDETTGDTGIYLGSRPRDWIADPVYGTEIRGNTFRATILLNIEQEYCATGSLILGNVDVQNGSSTPYSAGPGPCQHRRLLHPALIVFAL
jgi:parallel beta-helix repeat protein